VDYCTSLKCTSLKYFSERNFEDWIGRAKNIVDAKKIAGGTCDMANRVSGSITQTLGTPRVAMPLHYTFRQCEEIVQQKLQVRTPIVGAIGVELAEQLGTIDAFSIVAVKVG
jgi:hypothetical protein